MLALPTISVDVTAEQALKLLEQAGWRRIGIGDWSWLWRTQVTLGQPGSRRSTRPIGCMLKLV
jgi:hypothetical protein